MEFNAVGVENWQTKIREIVLLSILTTLATGGEAQRAFFRVVTPKLRFSQDFRSACVRNAGACPLSWSDKTSDSENNLPEKLLFVTRLYTPLHSLSLLRIPAMLTSLRALTFGLVAALTLTGSVAMASGDGVPEESAPNLSEPAPMGSEAPQAYRMVVGGSYSPSLGAEFRVENFFLPAFGQFTGVRLVSTPNFNSPLRNLGLQAGDVITRLDGVRVDNLAELENHYSWTQVRYIKTGSQTVRIGNIFINPNNGGGVQPIINGGGNAP
jgi:hypothetical protein